MNCSIDLTLLSQQENLTGLATPALFFSFSFYYLFVCFCNSFVYSCSVLSARKIVRSICPAQLTFSSHFAFYSLKELFQVQYLLSHDETYCQVSCTFMLRSSGRRHETVVFRIFSPTLPLTENGLSFPLRVYVLLTEGSKLTYLVTPADQYCSLRSLQRAEG